MCTISKRSRRGTPPPPPPAARATFNRARGCCGRNKRQLSGGVSPLNAIRLCEATPFGWTPPPHPAILEVSRRPSHRAGACMRWLSVCLVFVAPAVLLAQGKEKDEG